MKKLNYFFVGIGGSGMSSIAQYLVLQGCSVSGSDRSFDSNQNIATKNKLEELGIKIYSQTGDGVKDDIDVVVTSTAVESSIPDIGKALELNIKIIKRAQMLADIHNNSIGVAVGGTSGKSTVTGMLGHILRVLKANPSIINGGLLLNALDDNLPGLGNVVCGDGPCVVEADESDGSIELYNPAVAVVTNITLDHKPLEELRVLFADFIARAQNGAIINADCDETMALSKQNKNIITFSVKNNAANLFATDIKPLPNGVSFKLKNQEFTLQVAGKHNVSNALAAIGGAMLLGFDEVDSAKALASFRGIRRRLETIDIINGITIIDDFGHNPDKISATLATLQEYPGRILMMFQPHGYGPTRFLRQGLVDAYAKGMKEEDVLFMPEIFYAGGTTTKDISSKDLCDDIVKLNRQAVFCDGGRDEIKKEFITRAKQGDRIVVMGARDDSLRDFAIAIAKGLKDVTS